MKREKNIFGKTLRAAAWAFLLVLSFFNYACGNGSSGNSNKKLPALAGEGVDGKDLLSSSTNFSQKAFDPGQKADPLSGADFIAPPKISNYGAVSLGYKLELPPGRAGVMPQISLGYSSSGGDGWLGIGWSLGMGSVTRTTRNGQLFYDHRDTFTWGGKRLVKVSGTPYSENGEYRPEIEDGSFTRLTLTDAENGGVWTVEDSSGRKTIFGAALNERIYRPDQTNKTYSWQFSKTVDKNGNYMYAVYDTAFYATDHILYLKELRYTGNENSGDQPKLFVRFHLKDRSDFYVSKGPGFIMKMDKLLDKIEMGKEGLFGDSVLWDYQMHYTVSADSSRPLLQNVVSSKNTTKPVFHYQPAVHSLVWQNQFNAFASDPEINPDLTKYFEGDVDGDGISDMIFFNPETGDWKVVESHHTGGRVFKTYGNKFAGYDTEEEIQWFKGNVTGDYDGNGKSDIAFYLPKTREFWVAESRGDHFQFRMYGKMLISDVDIFKAEWFTGDYDGNGISDVVLFDEKTGSWIFMVNTGGSFSFIKFANHFKNIYRDDYSPALAMSSESTNDLSTHGKDRNKVHWLGGDYNGDGRSDIALYDARTGKWWVAENLRDDALGFRLEWKLYQIFNAPARALFSHQRFSGDFNGDGYSDFLLFDRDKLEWILGEVKDDFAGNPTVQFRIWSAIPEQRDITRWLQGDFNGDGRTDIGFYSQTDNNFWIGEATPNGFRYRIYSNISFGGPDPARVMATPAPEEGVKIQRAETFVAEGAQTRHITYEYDANNDSDHGELVFTGCFSGSCATAPEFLIYDKALKKFFFKQGDAASVDAGIAFDHVLDTNRFITPQRPYRNQVSGKDEIIVYEPDASSHIFFRIFHNGAIFEKRRVATFAKSNGAITNFDINKSLYLINDFNRADGEGSPALIVLDDQNTGNFYLFQNDIMTPVVIAPTGIAELPDLKNIFRASQTGSDRDSKEKFQFFSGNFDFDPATVEVLFVDMRKSPQKWYRVDLVAGSVGALSGNISLPQAGSEVSYSDLFQTLDLSGAGTSMSADELIYSTVQNGAVTMHRITVDGATIAANSFTPFEAGAAFRWNLNHEGKPIILTAAGPKWMAFGATGTTYNLEATSPASPGYQQLIIKRPDLYTKVYPFQWIQGDYNGDSKTDIGIFHLKEAKWYFAMTQGTVPDMIQKVENGVGGSYEFEYANSTSFDNTGADNIPDLPMNYKVCVKQTINDGMGKTVYNKYDYRDGFAWSAYVNGKKESDAFGFSTFITIDPMGSQTINTYHTTPYANFLLNRALGGALKETRFLGYDSKEYSKTQTDYLTQEIHPAPGVTSYLVYPSETRKYIRGTLTNTGTKNIQFSFSEYRLIQSTESSTDHYSDSARGASTTTSISNFEYVAATNQQRPLSQVAHAGTAFEVSTFLTYDANGNPIEQRTSYTGGGLPVVSDRVVQMEYDIYGNVIAKIDASASPAIRSEKFYDTTYHQFPVLARQFTGAINLDSTTAYSFDGSSFGLPIKTTDPNGNSSYIEYDSYGRVIRASADTEGGVQMVSEFQYSLPAAFFGAGEFPLSAKTIHHTGTGSNIESRTWKDGFGRPVQTVQSSSESTPGRLYVKTGHTIYDALGRVIRQSQPHWAADDEIDVYRANANEKYATTTEYDASGRVSKVTLPPAYAGEPETSVITTYNDPYEMIVTHSDGQYKTIVKNGRGQLLYVTEGNVNDPTLTTKMGFCYNGASKGQTYRQDLNGAALFCPPEFGVTVVPVARDSSGNNASYALYDAFGQLREANDPDFGKSTTEYDAFGRVTHVQDAKGQITQMQYDQLGRVSKKILPSGKSVTYKYDTLTGSANAKGKLVEMVDPAQRKRFSYDKRGNRNKETRELVSVSTKKGYDPAVTTEFVYDLAGRTEKIIYPVDTMTGAQVTACYSYNSSGFAETVGVSYSQNCQAPDKEIITNIDYDEFGDVSRVDQGNGVSTAYTYDVRGRATHVLTTAIVDGVLVKHQDLRYTYNLNNSIATLNNTPTQNTGGLAVAAHESRYEYTYDGLNRLVEATGSYGQDGFAAGDPLDAANKKFHRSYGYAKNGNLMQKNILDPETQNTIDAWSYTYQNHRVMSIQSSQFGAERFSLTYDANGNTLTKVDSQKNLTKQMVYDHANRIVAVKDQSGKIMGEYKYDDQGVRVRKITEKNVNGVTGRYVISTHNKYFTTERVQTLGKADVPGEGTAINHIYLNGNRIAAVDSAGNGAWFLANNVDSVSAVIDDSGAVASRTEYLPYGETFVESGTVLENGSEVTMLPKYNGQTLDEESDLYFFNARHYDPEIARFVTPDSVTDGPATIKGWNRYMYVGGNPVMYKDPTGHCSSANPMCIDFMNSVRQFVGGVIDTFGGDGDQFQRDDYKEWENGRTEEEMQRLKDKIEQELEKEGYKRALTLGDLPKEGQIYIKVKTGVIWDVEFARTTIVDSKGNMRDLYTINTVTNPDLHLTVASSDPFLSDVLQDEQHITVGKGITVDDIVIQNSLSGSVKYGAVVMQDISLTEEATRQGKKLEGSIDGVKTIPLYGLTVGAWPLLLNESSTALKYYEERGHFHKDEEFHILYRYKKIWSKWGED